MPQSNILHHVQIPPLMLAADLRVPAHPAGSVVFAHGSGSSRFSPRNRMVAQALAEAGFATLLLDLLTEAEAASRRNVFDIELLSERLVQAVDWVSSQSLLSGLPLGLFGASTGAAAALRAAAARPRDVACVISRGGRSDLAADALPQVLQPTLLIVGACDEPVLTWNREAMHRLAGLTRLEIVAGATHLFEEPGALEEVTALAVDWCRVHLAKTPGSAERARGRVPTPKGGLASAIEEAAEGLARDVAPYPVQE